MIIMMRISGKSSGQIKSLVSQFITHTPVISVMPGNIRVYIRLTDLFKAADYIYDIMQVCGSAWSRPKSGSDCKENQIIWDFESGFLNEKKPEN